MGKISGPQTISNLKSWQELMRFSAQSFDSIIQVLTNGLNFRDNFNTQTIDIGPNSTQMQWASPGPTTINHNLGIIPAGYLVISQNAAGDVFADDNFPATRGQITLNTSNSATTYRIIILG